MGIFETVHADADDVLGETVLNFSELLSPRRKKSPLTIRWDGAFCILRTVEFPMANTFQPVSTPQTLVIVVAIALLSELKARCLKSDANSFACLTERSDSHGQALTADVKEPFVQTRSFSNEGKQRD